MLTKRNIFKKSANCLKFFNFSTSERLKYAVTLPNTNVIEVKDFGFVKGLGLICADDIPKNSIIFQEKPYVIVPSFQETGLNEINECSVTFEELTRNTPLENKKEVIILSKILEEKMKRRIENNKKNNNNDSEDKMKRDLDGKIDIFLNENYQKGETPELLTMARLMIHIYNKFMYDYSLLMKQSGQNEISALTTSLKVVDNFMSVIFDDAIQRKAMPILSFQETTQKWLKNYFGDNKTGEREGEEIKKKEMNEDSLFQRLLEYQEFIKRYVKVNLNHFAVTIYSPIAIDLFGIRPALSIQEESEFKRQTGDEKLTSSALFNEWLDYGINHNLLFARALGVYPLIALMNHHCKNNVELKHSTNEQLIWVATRDIPAGSELTISYCGEGEFKERQKFLSGHHYFACPCESDEDCVTKE